MAVGQKRFIRNDVKDPEPTAAGITELFRSLNTEKITMGQSRSILKEGASLTLLGVQYWLSKRCSLQPQVAKPPGLTGLRVRSVTSQV